MNQTGNVSTGAALVMMLAGLTLLSLAVLFIHRGADRIGGAILILALIALATGADTLAVAN